jgi:predicted RNase H-like nuclease (RuvC/YqgF family)
MLRTWKLLGFGTALAFLLATGTALRADDKDGDADKGGKNPQKKTDEVIDALRQEIKDLREDIKKLKTKLEGLETDRRLQGQKDNSEINRLQQSIEDLEKKVTEAFTKVDKDMQELRGRTKSSAGAGPDTGGTGTGTIRMENSFNRPVTIRLNGRSYTLKAGDNLTLENQPAGTFTYEVNAEGFGVIQPQLTRTLGADKTFRIRVYTR